MHRFFVTDIRDETVVFSPEQARQIGVVLRMQPGQLVIALDNAGWEYEVALVEVGRKGGTAVIHHKRLAANEPTTQLTLYQSILKRDNFEWVLQKGTEIGVTRFVPLITERTVARLPKKTDRWQRILTEAAEQSRRGRIPQLADPVSLKQALTGLPSNQTALIPWEEAAGKGVREGLVDGDTAASASLSTSVSLFIGPEGGFTVMEIDLAQQHGVTPITLGKRILRAETAAIVAATLVLHALGEMD